MDFERLQLALLSERKMHLTFRSGSVKQTLDLSPRHACRVLTLMKAALNDSAEDQLTVSVLGHQTVRTHEAHGLFLRTQELGDIVFSLPPAILQPLIADLVGLASSSRVLDDI